MHPCCLMPSGLVLLCANPLVLGQGARPARRLLGTFSPNHDTTSTSHLVDDWLDDPRYFSPKIKGEGTKDGGGARLSPSTSCHFWLSEV
ncbi:hypothetical protein QBC42DRAFT_271522 [Cladorrhinum samala]|uniref:Secreted protein n=1 Tax=Cladorrhinum samala TaxID=585594 RepID=A0AAV9HKG9_9PEZI|nr:hypothetical protein QBC42DRAFT_271522 [Cladorrhinum samala]